jgi:tetratricopeptide (TPR) repeat protein
MKIYITLNNLFYILDELDRSQLDLWKDFLTYFEKNPDCIDFANFWFNKATERLGGGKSEEGGITILQIPQLPIFKIGQDLESRLGIKQGMVQKSFSGPVKFLYDNAEEVIKYFQCLIEKDPKNPQFYHAIGKIFLNKEDSDFNKAIHYFHKAIDLFPEYRKAHYDLGLAYIHAKDKKNAEEQVKCLNFINSFKYAEMLDKEINEHFLSG